MTIIPDHELRKTYHTIWAYWAVAFAFFLICIAVCYKLSISISDTLWKNFDLCS